MGTRRLGEFFMHFSDFIFFKVNPPADHKHFNPKFGVGLKRNCEPLKAKYKL